MTVWGDQAENCNKYLAKGRSVYIEGRLQTRSYDKDGQKHYATDIVADRVVFLGSGGGERAQVAAKAAENQAVSRAAAIRARPTIRAIPGPAGLPRFRRRHPFLSHPAGTPGQ